MLHLTRRGRLSAAIGRRWRHQCRGCAPHCGACLLRQHCVGDHRPVAGQRQQHLAARAHALPCTPGRITEGWIRDSGCCPIVAYPLSAVLVFIHVCQYLLLALYKANLQQGGEFGSSALPVEDVFFSCCYRSFSRAVAVLILSQGWVRYYLKDNITFLFHCIYCFDDLSCFIDAEICMQFFRSQSSSQHDSWECWTGKFMNMIHLK